MLPVHVRVGVVVVRLVRVRGLMRAGVAVLLGLYTEMFHYEQYFWTKCSM